MDENFQKNILMGKNNIENIAVRLNLKSATREDLNQVITPSIKLKMRYKVLVLNHGQQKDAVLSESMFNTAEIDGPIVKSHYRYSGVFLLQDYEFRRRVRAGAILTNQMIRKHLVLKRGQKVRVSVKRKNILLTGSVVAVDGEVLAYRVKYPLVEKLFQLK